MAEYHSIRELLEICECGNQKIWEVVMEQEAAESGLTEEQVFQKMERMYEAMRLADENYDAELRSGSGAATIRFIQALDSAILSAFSIARLVYGLQRFFPLALSGMWQE